MPKHLSPDPSEEYSDEYDSSSETTETSEHKEETSEEIDPALTMRYDDDDLRNVIFETIDDKYAKGKLGQLEVIMMKSNGYVNITKICTSAGKNFSHWKENASSKKLLKEVSKSVNPHIVKPVGEKYAHLMILDNKSKASLKGTYVHPKLAIHIAGWCSAKFAVLVSDATVQFLAKKATREKDKLLGIKDDKIAELTSLVKKQRSEQRQEREQQQREIAELLKLAKQQGIELKTTRKVLGKKLDDANEKLDDANERLDHVSDVLDSVVEDRVVKGKPCNDEILFIVENNCAKKDRPKDKTYYEYKAFRVAKKSKNSRLKSHKAIYPDAEIIFEINQPNSVNLWQRFADTYNTKKIKCKGCDFNLIRPCTKKTLVRLLNKMHDERLDYD